MQKDADVIDADVGEKEKWTKKKSTPRAVKNAGKGSERESIDEATSR